MKRLPFLATVLMAFTFVAHAQNALTKDEAKPAEPEVKVVLDSWNEIGRKITALAEDFPEDKYDFKPTPAERSFAEQLLHAAGSCYYFTDSLTGKPLADQGSPKRAQYKSKADIVAFVKKAFADGANAIQAQGEKGMTTEVVYIPGQKSRVLDIAYGIIEHSGEHYVSSLCTTASRVLCRRSRGPSSKAQEGRHCPLGIVCPISNRVGDWACDITPHKRTCRQL